MPDVFILGFTKCATTSMYNQLMHHPSISYTKRKEPHFHFSQVCGYQFEGPADNDAVAQMFVTNQRDYLNLYEPDKLKIDGSAMSIEDPKIIKNINIQFPKAKFIIMLRDPVDRAFSAYSHLIRDARETKTFVKAIQEEILGLRACYMPIWKNINSSRYVEAVQHARQLLGNRLKVVDFKDYVQTNKQVMDEVASFIDLEPIDWKKDIANRSGLPRSIIFQKLLMRKSYLKSIFINTFPEKMVTRIKRTLLEKNTGVKPCLNDDDKNYFKSIIINELDKIKPNTPDTNILTRLYS